ncbi:MAG TPA: efflux RND transporter periplasmic adaptor subunit [Acidobacteriaceae bacterium]|nr:efflux RND transporter periplasmic adaptor subunit [Acidobacteriaceae bacterium]
MAQPGKSKTRVWLWITLAVVAIIIAIYAYSHSHSAVPVRTARVAHEDLVSTVSTNGKVEPVQDFQAHAPAPGVVSKLYVHLGEHVTKNQQLIRMDSSEAASRVAAAQASMLSSSAALQNMQHGGSQEERLAENADLAAAQAELKSATASLSSLQTLQSKGAASANEVAAAQQRVAAAQAKIDQIQTRERSRYAPSDLAAQRAQLAQARSALTAAQSSYASVDVRAPFAGTVYALPVAQYDFVQAGEALLNIADLNRLQIRAYFDEPEIGKLAAGQPVRIVWDAKPNQEWHGHIIQAPTTVITYGTRNVGECLISVDDADGALLPNTNVTVRVTTLQRPDVLSLPREALHTEGNSNFVFKIVNNKLVRTPVQLGVVSLTRVEITSGLQEGDLVALGATTEADLTNGLQVKPLD